MAKYDEKPTLRESSAPHISRREGQNARISGGGSAGVASKPRTPTYQERHREQGSPNQQQQQQQQQSQQARHMENPEELLLLLLEAIKKFWLNIKRFCLFLMTELGGYEMFDKLARWAVRNPYLSLFLVACGIVVLFPFLIVLGFGISTILMTFTGFLVLEGTLLSLVSICLFACLGALAVVLVFFTIIAVATYFGFAHIYDLYGGGMKVAINRFLQYESPEQGQQQLRQHHQEDPMEMDSGNSTAAVAGDLEETHSPQISNVSA